MNNLTQFLKRGLKNTLLFKNNLGISHKGPWKQLYGPTLIDKFYIGDFSSVEYTISADYDKDNKEIIKGLLTVSPDTASIVVYARNHTLVNLVNLSATVNKSYVEIVASPVINLETNFNSTGTKVIFTGNYFHSSTPL